MQHRNDGLREHLTPLHGKQMHTDRQLSSRQPGLLPNVGVALMSDGILCCGNGLQEWPACRKEEDISRRDAKAQRRREDESSDTNCIQAAESSGCEWNGINRSPLFLPFASLRLCASFSSAFQTARTSQRTVSLLGDAARGCAVWEDGGGWHGLPNRSPRLRRSSIVIDFDRSAGAEPTDESHEVSSNATIPDRTRDRRGW